MASKLAAAKIAAWSGVRAVIAAADAPDVVSDAIAGRPVGTVVRARGRAAPEPQALDRVRPCRGGPGRGRRRRPPGALCRDHRSLLPAGVRGVEGAFEADDAVEIVDGAGVPFAKGLVRYASAVLERVAGRRTAELPDGLPHEVVHRDDLVVLP